MQSIDHLIDAVANYVSERSTEQGTFYFSKTDLKYAYSQIPLDPQLQHIRGKSNRHIQILKWILWSNRYASNIPKNH